MVLNPMIAFVALVLSHLVSDQLPSVLLTGCLFGVIQRLRQWAVRFAAPEWSGRFRC
jgi:hypothetical protein